MNAMLFDLIRRLLPVAVSHILLTVLTATVALAGAIDLGEPFPEIPLPQPGQSAATEYLGLPPAETFTLSQVQAEVVLVEMLNVLCPHCRKQTRPYNQLFQMIEDDPAVRGRIKLLGVAVANSDAQIEDFVDVYGVRFPVIPDRTFTLYRALRVAQTPLSVYVRQGNDGQSGVVAGHHLGEDHDMETLFAYLKELLTMQAEDFSGLADPVQEPSPPELPISSGQLDRLAKSAFKRLGPTSEFKSLDLASASPVFSARVGQEKLFAAVVSRSAICDVCHDVHYLILFSAEGELKAFESIMLTGYGNVDWSPEQIARMRKRVVGGRLGDRWEFNPEVDSISRATMSAAIVFDSLQQGGELLQALRRAGEIPGPSEQGEGHHGTAD